MTVPTSEVEIIRQLKSVIKMHEQLSRRMADIASGARYSSMERTICTDLARMSTDTADMLKEIVTGVGTVAMHKLPDNIEALVKALAE